MMTETTLNSMSEYRDGIQTLLANASHRFDLFDPDFVECGLETRDATALLSTRLSEQQDLEVRLLVHDPRHIEQFCQRLLELCRLRSPSIRIHVSASHHRNWSQPFALADGRHLVTRFHCDRSRGKLCLDDPAQAAPFVAQFETLFQASLPGPNGAFLGI